MVSRGQAAICGGLLLMVTAAPQPAAELPLTGQVDPFIGTGGHGHTHPAATAPFGMIQLGPDTRIEGWDSASGYHYSDNVIYGFTHTHLSGTGIHDYTDVLFMPTTGRRRWNNGARRGVDRGYASRFSHEQETASPGYYRVRLADYDIEVELTAAQRAGMHRYRFPGDRPANLVIDLSHRDPVRDSSLEFIGDREIAGSRISKSWAREQHVYFVAQFSVPFADRMLVMDGKRQPEPAGRPARGGDLRAVLRFPASVAEVTVRIGISAVSIAGARANLAAEIDHWEFDRLRQETDRHWEESLEKVAVAGGSDADRRVLYTALYHAMLAPHLFSDVSGEYRAMDGEIHRSDTPIYTVFSLWDTFRAEHPLLSLLEPDRTTDFLRTLASHYRSGGELPIWELAGNYTGTMIGYHAIPVIVQSYLAGLAPPEHVAELYEAMKVSAGADWQGLAAYRNVGFVPGDDTGESVSRTLEYAYDDACIARMARKLGHEQDYLHYRERAGFYANLYDPQTGFMRPKRNHSWVEPFDPREVTFHYTEANAWQYSFFVPQDVSGLMTLMGGPEAFVEKLDELFTTDSTLTGRRQPDITGLIGQYAHGNEPSHHTAYLYSYAGQPWKTQQRVREIVENLYSDRPDGLAGNEDCGQLSAWYVFSALGLYPVSPCSMDYVIGSPSFTSAAVQVGEGRVFEILAPRASPDNRYVQSATLDGRPLTRGYLSHAEIVAGGRLEVELGSQPSNWAAAVEDRPPSSLDGTPALPVPFVAGASRTFVDRTTLELRSATPGARVRYTLDGSPPGEDSRFYESPIVLDGDTTLHARAELDGRRASRTIVANFTRVSGEFDVVQMTAPAPEYSGNGPQTLVDTLRGGDDFRLGGWLGVQGRDVEAVIDLGRRREIRRIAAGFLQETRSWIWLPSEVEFAVSDDGVRYDRVATVRHDVSPTDDTVQTREFTTGPRQTHARYVRVRAASFGTIPEWHPGRGGQAWIFIDEVTVE